MSYVMLSRVQCIEQLFILKKLDPKRIFISKEALIEHEKMEKKSLNRNPTNWEKEEQVLKIAFLNIQSIRNKLLYLAADKMMLKGDVIALGETWLESDVVDPVLNLPGYQLRLNSWKHGSRGVGTYFKPDKLFEVTDIKTDMVQITKISSADFDVINIYRSPQATNAVDSDLVVRLGSLIDQSRQTIIGGDLNICFNKKTGHMVLVYLDSLGFDQLTTTATHIEGGVLDLVFSNHAILKKYEVNTQLYSPYYTFKDHDAVLVSVSLVGSKSLYK